MIKNNLVILILALCLLPGGDVLASDKTFKDFKSPDTASEISKLIYQAGSTDSDADRLDYLKQLETLIKHKPIRRPNLKLSDIKKMIHDIELWVGSAYRDKTRTKDVIREKGYLRHFFHDAYPQPISETCPLYPVMCFYKARMNVWNIVEQKKNKSNKRKKLIRDILTCFRETGNAFPENRIVRMYLGEPVPWPGHYASHPQAPEWANLQRRAIEGLTDIIHWWIDNRMREDGQFGGGWGDDCEMWRWWTPVMIGFDDPKITAAQERFSNALLAREHMQKGYTTIMSDVEHTAEDTADTITPMMHLRPNDPEWRKRAMNLSELMRTKWTGKNARGFLQFKNIYFTADRVDYGLKGRQSAYDTIYHPRVVQPALLLWQRTGDKGLSELFTAWMNNWTDAAMRGEQKKPPGILPSVIHWPDGRAGGDNKSEHWWKPRTRGRSKLYNWPSQIWMMNDTLLLTYYMTGDKKYLAPMRAMAKLYQKYLQNPVRNPKKGSKAWCASKMKFLIPTLAKYRALTGDTHYDNLLIKHGGYGEFLITGNKYVLLKAMKESAQAVSQNFEGFTSEVRYTDRVLKLPRKWFREMGLRGRESLDTEVLFSMLTGDPGNMAYFPLNAVRWLTRSRDIAALVTQSGQENFSAELFHFGSEPRSMGADLYLLKPGTYKMTLREKSPEGKNNLLQQKINADGRRTRVRFQLPPGRLCVLQVTTEK
ncbi:hypothetical protein [Desulfonema magnum]|uniref:Uncharacterized protein n=1 Tax=Desulfonema magnum TaxID=45655 RepID=A0A975BUB3_9BACT|nr:hypothetical protein [Desulfonema magnum]QTA91879.1 Uncharacterized protein dnm_079530 [Desulfonema magnum]